MKGNHTKENIEVKKNIEGFAEYCAAVLPWLKPE